VAAECFGSWGEIFAAGGYGNKPLEKEELMAIPLVSIIMVAYNRAQYIGAAIESLLHQTCQDFELIIVDDCSKDDTVAIAREYAARDLRITIHVNEKNLGERLNRNHSVKFARGEYLKFHDSDDCAYPYGLEMMLALLHSEPRAVLALSGHRCWPGGPSPMLSTPELSYQREFLGQGMFSRGPAAALFRTKFFIEQGGFEDIGPGSDYLFFMRACAKHPVLLVPTDLYWYHLHSAQEFNNPKADRQYAIMPRVLLDGLADPACPLKESEKLQAQRNVVYGLAKTLFRDLIGGRWALAWYRLKANHLSLGEWVRFLRRARRTMFAGTPVDEKGQFIIPDWSRFKFRP
jgi:hypothetical protein